jgi:hypothetical protein
MKAILMGGLQPIRLFAIGALTLLLTACTTTSSSTVTVGPRRYTELVPGVSTRDDAVTKLGPPNSVSTVSDADDQVLLQWIDVYSPHPLHVAIHFGRDGKMIRVEGVFNQ